MERANGFNVGVDAHFDPKLHGTTLYVEWDRVNQYFPIHRGTDINPPGRDDVGIVPYIPAELHSIQPGMLKPSGGGRLVAAPTWMRSGQTPRCCRCGGILLQIWT